MGITAIVLTFNEEFHLERCLRSLRTLADQVIVIDSFSTDKTVEIAKKNGATVIQRKFTTHAEQFNWALESGGILSDWILKIDADEFILGDAREKLNRKIGSLDPEIAGITMTRSIVFQDKVVKHGGVGKRKVLRLFRKGRGVCEYRRMDEHIIVSGEIVHVDVSIFDHNLRSVSWWIAKHNNYSTKEAIEILMPLSKNKRHADNSTYRLAKETQKIRNLKQSLYLKFPSGFRVFGYFLYRYILKLGILDNQFGIYHILSAFWYRMLVDIKVHEIQRIQKKEGLVIEKAVERFHQYEN